MKACRQVSAGNCTGGIVAWRHLRQAPSKQLLPRRRFLAVWIFDVVVLIPIAANKKYRKRCVTDRAIYYTFRFGNTLTDDVMWQLLNHVSCCKG